MRIVGAGPHSRQAPDGMALGDCSTLRAIVAAAGLVSVLDLQTELPPVIKFQSLYSAISCSFSTAYSLQEHERGATGQVRHVIERIVLKVWQEVEELDDGDRRAPEGQAAQVIGRVVSRGARPHGLLRYLFGPGRDNEHVSPHLAATWGGDPAALKASRHRHQGPPRAPARPAPRGAAGAGPRQGPGQAGVALRAPDRTRQPCSRRRRVAGDRRRGHAPDRTVRARRRGPGRSLGCGPPRRQPRSHRRVAGPDGRAPGPGARRLEPDRRGESSVEKELGLVPVARAGPRPPPGRAEEERPGAPGAPPRSRGVRRTARRPSAAARHLIAVDLLPDRAEVSRSRRR